MKSQLSLYKNDHKFPSVERIVEKLTFIQDIAIVIGKEIEKSNNAGQIVRRRFTNIWINTEPGWQLSARQSTKNLT